MTNYKYNKFVLILIIIGFLASGVISFERHKVEKASNTVDMLFGYGEVVSLAGSAGKTIPETLKLFKESGITSLVVYETTLEKLENAGTVNVYNGSEILRKAKSGMLTEPFWQRFISTGKIKDGQVYIVGVLSQDLLEVQEDLLQRFGKDRVQVLDDANPYIISIVGDYKTVIEQDLGILTSQMQFIAQNGFNVVARPTNYYAVTEDNINHVFRRLEKANVPISAVLFSGREVLGYPEKLDVVADNFKARNWTLGMTEHPLQLQFDKQEGLVKLGEKLNYNVARLYVIDKTEQEKKLDPEQAIRRWALTDEERNVRLNYIRAFKNAFEGKNLLDTNLDYVAKIRDGVLKRDFQLGAASVFEPYHPNKVLLMLVFLGIVAAGIMYLSMLTEFLTHRRQLLATILVAGMLSGLYILTNAVIIRQALGFCAAVLFPVLAMVWQMENWKSMQLKADNSLMGVLATTSWQLVATVLLSLVGGIYVSGILSDIRFLLEFDIYRGVKLTFLMPLILITLVYLKRYTVFGKDLQNQKGLVFQLQQLLNYPIYLKTLFILGVGAIVAYIFIGRTGHTAGIPVPGIEIKLRVFLEEVMYARPREKEFLVGHPAFFLAAFAAWKNLPHVIYYCLVVGATIGQSTLVQTFAHMRTPVMMSTIRAIDGLFMGEVIGIVAFVGASLALPLWYWILRRYEGEA